MIKQFIRKLREYYQRPSEAIYLIETAMFGNEYQFVKECLHSGKVSTIGTEVERLEQAIIQHTGAKYAIATSSGTAALHLGLLALGVKPNDWVLTTPFTFVATANAIVHSGASPMFLDIDRHTLGLSPEVLAEFLANETYIDNSGQCVHTVSKRRITVCLPVHVFGHPAHMTEIVQVCNQYGITVLEDSAEGLGSTRNNQPVGTNGKAGVLSFNGNKIVTTGGGGALLTSDLEVYQSVRSTASSTLIYSLLSSSAEDKPLEYGLNANLPKLETPGYSVSAAPTSYKTPGSNAIASVSQAQNSRLKAFVGSSVGYNYRMPALNAALGLAQWEHLDQRIQKKRDLAYWYQSLFANSEVKVLDEPTDCFSNFWLNALIFPERNSRDQFVLDSTKAGIESRPVWTLLSRYPSFTNSYQMPLPNARWAESCMANIPSTIFPHA
ncbi:MAG: DegT/DnrJ/EryC1/StrS family aminotransferase [Bacteroidota bacterium]